MENANAKILTLSFAIAGSIFGFTIHLLLKALSGAFGVVARFIDSDLVRHGLPVGLGFALFLALQLNPKVLVWGEDVISEIKKVVWPSRKDTTAMTIVVIIMVLISSVIVTSFDFVSGLAMKALVR